MSKEIRITVPNEIDEILEKAARKIGKKKSTFAADLVFNRLFEMSLITTKIKEEEEGEHLFK